MRSAFTSLLALLALAGAGSALAGQQHTYSTTVTIKVLDRATHKVGGKVLSDAPSTFCTDTTVRVRRPRPGRDAVVARVFTNDFDAWRVKLPGLKGKRVYAEVLKHNLPERPVTCLGDRSRAITVP